MDYAYKRCGTSGFMGTIEAVERSVRDHGFVIQRQHDIGAALAAKGFPIRPLMIFEVAPAEEVDDPVTLIMPCRINVYEDDSDVVIAALRPSLFSSVFPEHELDDIASRFEEKIVEIVDGAVDGQHAPQPEPTLACLKQQRSQQERRRSD